MDLLFYSSNDALPAVLSETHGVCSCYKEQWKTMWELKATETGSVTSSNEAHSLSLSFSWKTCAVLHPPSHVEICGSDYVKTGEKIEVVESSSTMRDCCVH